MTSPAELNAARLSQQLEINRQKLAVKSLQQQARTGARWSNIRDDWNKSDESVKLTRKTLTNLNGQNEGLKNQPGYVSTKVKLTQNITETNVLINDLDVVRSTTQRTENISVVTNNLPRDSAGTIVKNEQIGSVQNSRFTTPITGNDQFFNATTQEVEPVVASINKNTNARISSLSVTEDQALGDVKGSGTTSTVGGSKPVVKLNQTQNQNNLSGESLKRSTDDDSTTVVSNSVGNASQAVEGRAEVAAEFLQTIKPSPNKLAGLASQTYTISIYLMNQEEYKQLLGTDKKILPTDQLLMQSGGAPVGKRNRFFDLDFFVENLEFTAKIGYQGTQSPHNVLTMDFEVLEPNGITLLERLRQAVWEHTGDRTQTINGQNYLMVIRFFGYDDLGNLVSNAPGQAPKPEQTSDPNALVEKFIPFQIAQIDYKISSEAVQYDIKCTIPQTMIGYSTARGTIPFNFQLSAIDVQTLLNGDTQLQQAQPQIIDTDDDEALEVAERAPPAKKVGLKGATITQGLATALNEHQKALAVKTPGYIPDQYSIELENVAGLKDAKMRKQGTQNKRRAPLQDNPDVNQKLNQKKQNYDTNTKNYSVNAGTQIVQLIDQVMKNSTYITAQQSIAFDEVTKRELKNPPVKTVQWYKISQIATPIAYDPVRQDYAYDIKFIVTRYQINTPRSPYFPPAMYRGVHKLYNYWFTGQNTEVINFEIQSSSNYITPINNSGIVNEPVSTFSGRFAEKRFFQTSADESTQGGEGESTLPAAQLASRLYTRADVAKCDIDIIGDPDFIAQSELFYTSSNLAPFEKDGSANFQASEVLFEVRFNRPADYDMPTGLTPVYQNNTSQSAITGESNLPEESLVFTAIMVKSFFKQGKFTQTIQGTIRDFNTAVDSPKQKKAESNIVEEVPGLDAFGGSGETVRATKKDPVPPYDDAIQRRARGLANASQKAPTGVNRPPDYISGAGRPSGLKPTVNQGSKITPYSSATVNNATTRRIAESGINGDVDYTGSTIDTDTDNWQPPVQPKPGSKVVSDDAGSRTGFSGSLLKKKTQRALESSKRRVKSGATVVGGQGGGTNSSAFR